MSPPLPQRKLSLSSNRQPSHVQDLFLGLAFQLDPQPEPPTDKDGNDVGRDLEYATVIHDGTGAIESETFKTKFYGYGKDEEGLSEETKRVSRMILEQIREFGSIRNAKVSDCLVLVIPWVGGSWSGMSGCHRDFRSKETSCRTSE